MTLVESIVVFAKAARQVKSTWKNEDYNCIPWKCSDRECENYKRYLEAIKKIAQCD